MVIVSHPFVLKDLDKAVKLYGDIGHQAITKNTIDNLF
jgi:hypothetical protein